MSWAPCVSPTPPAFRTTKLLYALVSPIVKNFRGSHGPIPARPTPLVPIPSEHLPPDLMWTRFWLEKGDFRSKSGQNRVQIRSCRGVQRGSWAEGWVWLKGSSISRVAKLQGENQKPEDHPNFRKKPVRVKRPFSELSESSGEFSEQLSEFSKRFSECEIPFSEWHLTTWAIILGATPGAYPGAIPSIDGNPHERFSFAPTFLEHFTRIGLVPARNG